MSFLRFLALAAAASTAYAAPTEKRQSACTPLPLGAGPNPTLDDPISFMAYGPFASNATAAVTPAGYVQAYSNLHTTYDEPSQFVQYIMMATYDVQQCANYCNNNPNCNAFTIFYERLPTLEPGPGCMDPAGTTHIKCDLWAGTIGPDIDLNAGQGREDFDVVMAGSNGYVKNIFGNDDDDLPTVPTGYTIEAYEHGAAIEAPLDCFGQETYMGMSYWSDGRFDINRCIAACENAGAGDVQGRECRFANTYMQRYNGVPYSQHCAMYSQYWPAQYATNYGQLRDAGEVDISDTDSYGIRDITGNYSACLPGGASSSSSSSQSPSMVTVTTTSTASPTSTSTITMTRSATSSFTSASVAPETFSDWDPVSETTTYSGVIQTGVRLQASLTSASDASETFTPAVVAPETFTDWDPVSETMTHSSAESSFTPAIVAPETFTDWEPTSYYTTYSSTPAPEPTTFSIAIVAPETFSDWDPVSETITYVGH